MLKKTEETVKFLLNKISAKPEIGIVLGTGLGELAKEIKSETEIEYKDIPNFPVSTVEGHSGKLIFGELSGRKIVAMKGRFHYYEGYSMQEVTFPVRVMKQLGINLLILSNASGAVNPDYELGDLMILNDHINLFPENPLRGKNYEELGPRFPDMSQAYSPELIEKAEKIAAENNIKIRKGVYAGLAGPTFETPAEYRYLRIIGADTVGMSTVPETIVARHMKLPVFAVSVITDSGAPEKMQEISHEEVQKVAQKAEPKLSLLIKEFIK